LKTLAQSKISSKPDFRFKNFVLAGFGWNFGEAQINSSVFLSNGKRLLQTQFYSAPDQIVARRIYEQSCSAFAD